MAIKNEEYQTFTNAGTDKTLKEFLFTLRPLTDNELATINVTEAEILAFRDNSDFIFAKYTDEDRESFPSASADFIKSGTVLKIPTQFLNEGDEIIKPKVQADIPVVDDVPFNAFVGEKNEELIQNEQYKPSLDIDTQQFGVAVNSVDIRHLNINVFIFSRVHNKLINISGFIMNCSTNVGEGGGNWKVTLPPITAEYDTEGNLKTLNEMDSIRTFVNAERDNYVHKDATSFPGEFKRVPEPAVGDREAGAPPQQISPKTTQLSTGTREIEKPLYFNVAFQPQDMVFIKFEQLLVEEEGNKRVLDQLKDVDLRQINGDVFDMMGLIDQVNVGFDPPTANATVEFSGRDFTKLILEDGAYFFPGSEDTGSYQSNYYANRSEVINERSFIRVLGAIRDLALYINKPVSHTMTYIFSKLSVIQVFPTSLFDFLQPDDDTDSSEFLFRTAEIPSVNAEITPSAPAEDIDPRIGIWKLIRLIIDPEVKDKIMVDSSIATNSGSIQNFIQRICQKPFVEFFTDTYGDRFYWIVRKPPWNKEAFLSNTVIEIEEKNLLNHSLIFSDAEAYSWYRLIPLRAYSGNVDMIKFTFPAIFFPEYAEIFGSRPLEHTSNYVNYGQTVEQNQDAFNGSKQELRFMIESHALLPFVRSGTITINGDRRIKKGMNVYLKSTDELFYVNSVSNRYNIAGNTTDRVTVLDVSRGIVNRYADKYFDLIEYREPTEEQIQQRIINWRVNKENFEFLLNRKQLKP